VQQEVEGAIARLTGSQKRVFACSRTDAGVHALALVCCFSTDSPLPAADFARALTSRLPADVAVLSSEEAAKDFDPAKVASKTYRYTIMHAPARPVLELRTVWHVPVQDGWRLDVPKMRAACACLEGTHDWTSFAHSSRAVAKLQALSAAPGGACALRHAGTEETKSAPKSATKRGAEQVLNSADDSSKNAFNNVRTVLSCTLETAPVPCQPGGVRLTLSVTGRGFVRSMVRNIAGFLVDVGRGRVTCASIGPIFDLRDRAKVVYQGAPAQGLVLAEVRY
jgi:tRNA pseudouridine38-40 synthase